MSDRLNWYPETGPERRARRHRRFQSAGVWIAVAAIVFAVLLWMGGPFSHGTRCSTSTRSDSATGYQTVRMECHQVHSWRP
jgi:uncharacterized membrane protein YfbV (UPF0208 family)